MQAIEERDGVTFFVQRTSPLRPVQLVRMPGLFLRWELEPLFEPGADYHIEPAGALMGGSELFAVFQKKRAVRPSEG